MIKPPPNVLDLPLEERAEMALKAVVEKLIVEHARLEVLEVIRLPTEPPDKGLRYVIVVSSDAQNHHPRASTVVVVPIGTTLRQNACLQLTPGQTGLPEMSEVWTNAITTVAKKDSNRRETLFEHSVAAP